MGLFSSFSADPEGGEAEKDGGRPSFLSPILATFYLAGKQILATRPPAALTSRRHTSLRRALQLEVWVPLPENFGDAAS